MLVAENLPVGARLEVAVWLWMFSVYDVAIVVWMLPDVFCSIFHLRMDVDEAANRLANRLVEVDEIVVLLLEERTDVVSIVFEERTLAIGRLQGIPVDAPPLVMVADAHISHLLLLTTYLYRYCQRLHPVGCGYDTTVAVGLLLVGVVLLDETMVVALEFLIPLHRAEVGCL